MDAKRPRENHQSNMNVYLNLLKNTLSILVFTRSYKHCVLDVIRRSKNNCILNSA